MKTRISFIIIILLILSCSTTKNSSNKNMIETTVCDTVKINKFYNSCTEDILKFGIKDSSKAMKYYKMDCMREAISKYCIKKMITAK